MIVGHIEMDVLEQLSATNDFFFLFTFDTMLKTISNEEHLQQPTIHIEDMEEAEEQVMNNNDGSSKKKVVSRISMFFQQKKEKQKTPASESDEPYIGSGNYMCNSDATQVKVEQQHQQSHGLYFPTDHHLDPFASSMSSK